jgi:hypothetical protein
MLLVYKRDVVGAFRFLTKKGCNIPLSFGHSRYTLELVLFTERRPSSSSIEVCFPTQTPPDANVVQSKEYTGF